MYNKKYVAKQLKNIIKQGVFQNIELKTLSSFKVGGVADFVVKPKTLEEIVNLILFLRNAKIDHYIIGNGTNILFSDKGFRGVIIKLSDYEGIEKHDRTLKVLGGTSLMKIIMFANKHGLGGMQDGAGIPGTIGGAVIMNASAYGFVTESVVIGVLAMIDGKITYLNKEQLKFTYRNSVFSEYKNAVVLRVDLLLTPQDKTLLMDRSKEIVAMRVKNQPLNYPNCGSVFKRLEGVIVSRMLDEQGFKGFRINGAKVSEKHAGFIVNVQNACANDIYSLIQHIKKEILLRTGLVLEEEIRFLGEFEVIENTYNPENEEPEQVLNYIQPEFIYKVDD